MLVKITNDRAAFLEAKAKYGLPDIFEEGAVVSMKDSQARGMIADGTARPVSLKPRRKP